MGRKVRCAVTKEYGDSEEFVKIDGKYYKSQAIYDVVHREKALWNEIIRLICEDLLGYSKGQVFPSLITRKLKEYEFYDREVILETFELKKKDILYQLNQDGKFDDDNGKIFYMFAIIKSSINDVLKQHKRKEKQENSTESLSIENISDITIQNNNTGGRDISRWLEEDDL